MNTDSGEIRRILDGDYQKFLQGIPEAERPNWVPVSERVADAVEIGMEALNRAERRDSIRERIGR